MISKKVINLRRRIIEQVTNIIVICLTREIAFDTEFWKSELGKEKWLEINHTEHELRLDRGFSDALTEYVSKYIYVVELV